MGEPQLALKVGVREGDEREGLEGEGCGGKPEGGRERQGWRQGWRHWMEERVEGARR